MVGTRDWGKGKWEVAVEQGQFYKMEIPVDGGDGLTIL